MSDGTVILNSYEGKDEKITLPSTIEGLSVVSVKDYIKMPETVKEVVVPSSVKSLGYGAFNSPSLTKVTLNEGHEIQLS